MWSLWLGASSCSIFEFRETVDEILKLGPTVMKQCFRMFFDFVGRQF